MLPVTHGEKFTRLHILLYTVILFAVTLMPFISGMSGAVTDERGAARRGVLAYAWKIHRDYSDELARKAFRYSIVYLSLLFAALLVDHYARPLLGVTARFERNAPITVRAPRAPRLDARVRIHAQRSPDATTRRNSRISTSPGNERPQRLRPIRPRQVRTLADFGQGRRCSAIRTARTCARRRWPSCPKR